MVHRIRMQTSTGDLNDVHEQPFAIRHSPTLIREQTHLLTPRASQRFVHEPFTSRRSQTGDHEPSLTNRQNTFAPRASRGLAHEALDFERSTSSGPPLPRTISTAGRISDVGSSAASSSAAVARPGGAPAVRPHARVLAVPRRPVPESLSARGSR